MSTQTVEDKDFSEPDEVRHFKNGRVELLSTIMMRRGSALSVPSVWSDSRRHE